MFGGKYITAFYLNVGLLFIYGTRVYQLWILSKSFVAPRCPLHPPCWLQIFVQFAQVIVTCVYDTNHSVPVKSRHQNRDWLYGKLAAAAIKRLRQSYSIMNRIKIVPISFYGAAHKNIQGVSAVRNFITRNFHRRRGNNRHFGKCFTM